MVMEGSKAETAMVVGVKAEGPAEKGVRDRHRGPKIKGSLASAKRGLVMMKIFDSMFGSPPFPPKAEDPLNTDQS